MMWMDCKCVKRARSAKAVIPPFGALAWKWPDANADVCMYICIFIIYIHNYTYTSSTAQSGGGSFKNRKPIGKVGCCESGMAERSH